MPAKPLVVLRTWKVKVTRSPTRGSAGWLANSKVRRSSSCITHGLPVGVTVAQEQQPLAAIGPGATHTSLLLHCGFSKHIPHANFRQPGRTSSQGRHTAAQYGVPVAAQVGVPVAGGVGVAVRVGGGGVGVVGNGVGIDAKAVPANRIANGVMMRRSPRFGLPVIAGSILHPCCVMQLGKTR